MEGMEHRLNGRHALVGGASKGIGRAAAMALAERGARVTLVSRDEVALTAVRDELPAPADGGHSVLAADLGAPDTWVDRMRAHIEAHPVHIVVNNAGGPAAGPLVEADPTDFQAAFAIHVLAAQRIAAQVLPGMRAAGYGRFINVISTSVKAPIPGLGVSNTIRGAMASWAKTLAGEAGPDGITVNNVLPGFTDTGRLRSLIAAKAERQGLTEDQVADAMRSAVPLRRFARPEETAAAIAFLASPAASYINGINLPVDGGRLASL